MLTHYCFYCLSFMSKKNLAECDVYLRYAFSDSLTETKIKPLSFENEKYKNYYCCKLKIPTDITNAHSNTLIWLEMVDSKNDYILKSKKCTIPLIIDENTTPPEEDKNCEIIDGIIYFGGEE